MKTEALEGETKDYKQMHAGKGAGRWGMDIIAQPCGYQARTRGEGQQSLTQSAKRSKNRTTSERSRRKAATGGDRRAMRAYRRVKMRRPEPRRPRNGRMGAPGGSSMA
jgi:hypothetical protein